MRKATTTTIKPSLNGTSTQVPDQGGSRQIRKPGDTKNLTSPNGVSTADVVKNVIDQKLRTKESLPPITPRKSQQRDEYDNVDDKKQDVEDAKDNHLPLKLFDGKKQSLDELNAESMTYIWLRRFKEIFLHMNNGEDDNNGIDPFVEFDMNLAKIDMADTCDRYIENERFTLLKQQRNPVSTATSQKTAEIDDEKAKIDLAKKQEWDMKKLYAEVFKMSYKQNPLRTQIEQDELVPTKTGDDQPNFVNAIWWYSCDKASIYYQINSIVRLENFELLMSYRYYLSDLCRLIEFMYQKRLKEEGDIERQFYRADNINEIQLKMMSKRQKAQFISLLGFISTTSDMEIAKGYARKQRVYEGNVRVLFIITVKPHLPCTAFAYIDRISFHPEEKEVLFSMGSSFVVEEILEPANGENYYRLHLTACEINKSLVDDIRIKVGNCSSSGRAVLLARYLVELGEYRAARKYLTSLLTQAGEGSVLVNDISLAGVYSCLGMTYARQGLHGDALKAFKQALNTQARLEYSNNNALAEIHNNIGLAYVGLGHMDEAEATFAKAARMQLREPKSNQQYLASIYSNIGYVHYKQKDYDEAEKSFKKAEKLYNQNTSRIAHDALESSLMKAEFLTNYGRLLSVHKHTTSNRKPEHLYNEALKLYKSVLSDGDPKLMQTYINIMLAFAQNKSYSEVTKCFDDPTVQKLIDKQEANMFELNSSITQASLGSLYELVGACYASQDQYNKAIQVWKDAYLLERKGRLEQLLLVTTDGSSSILTAEHNRFIHEWYRKAINHYITLSNEKNDDKQDQEPHFSVNLCLGLLYGKLHNQHSAIECLKKTTAAAGLQSDKEVLFVAYLLLADMCKRRQQNQEAIANFIQALKLIQLDKNQKDPVLEAEVNLSRIDCHKDEVITDELQKLRQSFQLYGSDTKYICLKVIVLDTLARYCLIQEQYKPLERAIDQSISLKQGSLSQYHPSLAIDFIFRAQSHVQQAERLRGESSDIANIRRSHYREALVSYERALEIYNLNLSNDHVEVKRVYYAMGDILCDMDELSKAMEKYDFAENTYSELDDNNTQTLDEEDTDESIEIWMARASMHRHLAEYHARKKVFKEAIVEMTETINLYSKQVPSSVYDNHNRKMLPHDVSIILENLHHLAQCYAHLGDILGVAQNDDDGYFVALDIYMKLVPHNKSLEKDEALLYKKISDYYENLGDHDDALTSFQKAVDLEEISIAALYKLGHLNDICHKPDESMKIYQKLLAYPSIREHKQFKQIIQKKFDAAQKFKDSQQWQSKRSTPSADDSHHHQTQMNSPSNQPHQNADQTSTDDVNTTATNAGNEPFDDRAMAAAYLKFEDFDMAMKFYEKDIKKRSQMISDRNIFKVELEKIEKTSYTHNQQSTLPVLPKLFCSLVNEIQKIVILTDSHVSALADSFVQCAAIHMRLSSHLKVIKDYVAAFGLYASESEKTNNEARKKFLIDIMTSLLKDFMNCKLKPKRIIDIYVQLSLPKEANQVHLKLLAMHHDNELDDVDDDHSIGGSSHDPRTAAVQHYKSLLMTTNDADLKGVCYYNILRLYKHHLHPDQEGKEIVNGLIQHLQKFHILDRRLLAEFAMDFLHEYDKGSADQTLSQKWHLSAKGSLNTQTKDSEESFIGLFLFDIGNLSAAEAYWRSIIKQIESGLSSRVLDLVHDSDTTLKDILQAMEHLERDNKLLCDQLATAYEKTADYCMEQATNGRAVDRHSLLKANTMYKKAINLLERLDIDTNRINNIKMKQPKSEETTRKK